MNDFHRKIAHHARCLSVIGWLLGSPGCGDRYALDDTPQVADTGALRLALQTGGEGYRLIDAVFVVSDETGGVVATLESDADAGEARIERALPQGRYSISLQGGWRLQQDGESVHAALVTANPNTFEIKHGRVTELAYVFATERGYVTLGEGDVALGVDVVNAKTLADCSLLDPSSCPAGQTCLLADDSGETFCAVPGELGVGEVCESERCVAGAQCLSSGDDAGAQRVCTQFCDPHATYPQCECRSLSFDEDVGICVGPAACEPNCDAPRVFSFTDAYYRDDVATDALYEFFAGLEGVSDTSYIAFEIADPNGGGGAWCATNAAFYVNSYLSYAPTYHSTAYSGAWEHYYRSPGSGWVGPLYNGYINYYGPGACGSAYGWCSELGVGNLYLYVYPGNYGYENSTGADGSVVTISVARTRLGACGF